MEEQSEFYVDERGNKFWYLPSKGKRYFHQIDGPAIEYSDGTKQWYIDGKLHRLDGPATVWLDGTKEWWVDGKRHRIDGPAINYADRSKYWYIDGKQLNTGEIEIFIKENKIDLTTQAGQMAFRLRWA